MNAQNTRYYISYARFVVLLVCCFAWIDAAPGAKMHTGNVVFTRLGIVVELEESISQSDQEPLQGTIAGVFETKETSPALRETRMLSLPLDKNSAPLMQWIDSNRLFIQCRWKPQASYRIELQWPDDRRFEADITAPLKPIAYRIRTVELDTLLSLLANLQRPAKPTTLAFSPDGGQLAIATDAGHVAIVHPLTGREIWKTRISEGYVKHGTFSPDGGRFYIGEQSADGFIYAYNLSSAKPTLSWKYRLADDIDTSKPQNPNDVYAWVQYPGPYRIAAMADGDLLVAGVHSWTREGRRLNKAQLYRFNGETGDLRWKWPADGIVPMIISWFDYSRDSRTVALLAYTREEEETTPFKSGTLYVIDGEAGTIRWEYTFEPLKPYYESVTFWRGIGVSPNGEFINVTTDDGRAFIFNGTRPQKGPITPVWGEDLTTPLEVSGLPITATAGTIAATDDFALFVTGDTFIPYHLQKGAQQPPSGHPNGRTLFAYSWAGEKIWQWNLENMPQGLRIDAAGQYAAITMSKYTGEVGEQLHGISTFDLTAKGAGLSKYLYTYRTEGQLPYDTISMSADGRFIALIESPVMLPDETQRGKNRVHVIQ